MEIAVLGNEHFVLGFETAGVRNTFVAEKENINKVFEKVMERKDIGILIMDNKDFELLNERLKEKAMTQVQPTVVVLSYDVSAEENLRLMIKRSLGIDVWERRDVNE
ncbi:MAG: V-type ATP synthase subunit F [Candidatus Aenigmatarchaeota archaeon]|nr:MAG: V-type ATP synthase subunit F [Candidatus Aenigmarchaeota archaeon]RLJ08036.1 MAG: V-type ATP synthase subunit F [Candidatus Aenigmarchaeota archaeon]RLJ08647.1 MAG: V-type ATP synthase subunit F [Candidatus Aenigmarchaeota archaeon]